MSKPSEFSYSVNFPQMIIGKQKNIHKKVEQKIKHGKN